MNLHVHRLFAFRKTGFYNVITQGDTTFKRLGGLGLYGLRTMEIAEKEGPETLYTI